MAFHRTPAKAIVAARRLWGVDDKMTLIRRFTIAAKTVDITSEALERGLFEGSPSSWASFRDLADAVPDALAFRFTTLGMLFAYAGSPGTMWLPQSAPTRIPAGAQPARPDWEDVSWMPGNLDSPGELIPELENPAKGGL